MSSPKNACVGGYICLAARWFRLLWTISFEFAKVCWIRFSSWESSISFHIWGCSNFMEKVVLIGKGAISTETSSRAFYCMQGECEQIVMKLRLRFKDSYNN